MEKGKKKPATKKASKASQQTPQTGMLAAYDWGDEKLTDKQRTFIFYFTWPGQDGFHCAARAAKKAGYSQAVTNSVVYKMLRDPKIQKLIQKNEQQAKTTVHDAAQRFIQEKIIRADYSVKDFFDVKDQVNSKTGNTRRVFMPKKPGELTEEQLLCIDNIEPMQGGNRIVFADRQKERDSIIALDAAWNGSNKGNEYDVEETKEIIMERITIRQERRTKQAAEADKDIVIAPLEAVREEL